ATTAAFGAVATGTFTALVPSSDDGVTTSAAADEAPVTAMLTAHSGTATDNSSLAPAQAAAAALLPVADLGGQSDAIAAGDQHLARLDKAATLAAKLAEQHAQEAENARIRDPKARGGLDAWIAQALQITDLPQSYAPGVKKIIMAESGGNPRAINTWDSNARRGTPSQGLMQTIPSTYRHYVHPDVADRPITDPVANITAGVRYMVDNYGPGTLAAGGRTNSRGGYVGY
ncbi:MAG TPA: transglycosylase SLT domain-containing protein, partial [Pseudonocardia sp.]|nr:transglycosylase SLT domain-containing protein [Pseudonocardia sp.]